MGSGVAQALAQSGLSVVVVDIDQAKLEQARGEIANALRFRALFGSSEKLEAADAVMERIQFTTEHQQLSDVSFVIENATESWEVKRDIYELIDGICREDCIFMINTSCISITKLAAVTGRPAQVIGTHFMNPVPAKKTVEVIRGFHTSDACVSAVGELMGEMGKEMIVVNDYPGFVSNRISHLFMNEAAFVVQDGVASAEEVDDIFKKCYGHAMGPLETADLIGLDTVVHSLKVLYDSYQDPKFRCCPLLQKMVDAGLHGRKSGQGFYSY
ncbi:3-hydroxyacyl-CoA dehydrogenase NAD-binding domain-containing protein [Paenibacillus pasadenensis]|nr:3-hydroxyacyl-CoA dehydrogenase NAD-binding domain-containing protein [Paenibacillus pasadenensis]